MADQILPFVYMLGILLLVLPAFLQSNSKLKQFLTNLTIWIVIILINSNNYLFHKLNIIRASFKQTIMIYLNHALDFIPF